MDETLDLLNKEIQDKQIRINRQYPSGKLFLWSDAYQIRQVLMNLLNNAIHAAGKKGSIGLSGSETRDAVVVEIKDNGPGIPKENIGKIFEPFFTTKSFEEGTGLGLFVVHKIVSDLAGQIEVNSTLGKGTVFTLKFPRMAGTKNLGMDKDEKI
jgi:signal transduction histidine kinase